MSVFASVHLSVVRQHAGTKNLLGNAGSLLCVCMCVCGVEGLELFLVASGAARLGHTSDDGSYLGRYLRAYVCMYAEYVAVKHWAGSSISVPVVSYLARCQ